MMVIAAKKSEDKPVPSTSTSTTEPPEKTPATDDVPLAVIQKTSPTKNPAESGGGTHPDKRTQRSTAGGGGQESEMYMNGNLPYYGGYYANSATTSRSHSRSSSRQRYLPFATSSAQTGAVGGATTSSEDHAPPPPPPPPSSSSSLINGNGIRSHQHQHHQIQNQNLQNYGQNHRQHAISDTVAMAGDDLSSVPAAVIIQLEKANRTIASQTLEIERLKSYQNQHVETHLLKKQIQDLEKEMRSSRARFLEQQELLAEMSREMDNLLREKIQTQANYQEMEKKYKKAKFASRELAKILENDLCGTPTERGPISRGYESEGEEEDTVDPYPLFQKSRSLSRAQKEQELHQKAEKIMETSGKSRKNEEIIEKLINENETLIIELDREKRMTESLQDDLEKNRRMVIDRDEKLEEMKVKLGKAETKATQCESDLTRTSTDLAMERLRCEALTAELHEIEGIFRNTHSTIQAYAAENEQLEDRCREAHRQIVTLNSKLEAQGIDLVTTKRTLRTLRETNETRSGPF